MRSTDKLNQFLGPQTYTWVEFMSILGILFSGEERIMIRKTTYAIGEREHPLAPGVDLTDRKFLLEDPYWINNDPNGGLEKIDY
jgi:hypothetical protein